MSVLIKKMLSGDAILISSSHVFLMKFSVVLYDSNGIRLKEMPLMYIKIKWKKELSSWNFSKRLTFLISDLKKNNKKKRLCLLFYSCVYLYP